MTNGEVCLVGCGAARAGLLLWFARRDGHFLCCFGLHLVAQMAAKAPRFGWRTQRLIDEHQDPTPRPMDPTTRNIKIRPEDIETFRQNLENRIRASIT